MENTTDKIPVIVLAGFLGSGKTTILNNILRQINGRKIGVIVNDFGDVNIDSLLVSKQADDTMELSGGCICCQMSEGGLDETLESFAHPGTTIDAIIIEASGIAEPADIRKLILYSRNTMVTFGGIMYVIDGVNFGDLETQHPELRDHVQDADLIIMSKADRMTARQRKILRTRLESYEKTAPIIEVAHGNFDATLLLDQPITTGGQLHLTSPDKHTHLHSAFHSVSFHTEKPLSPKLFDACLETLPSEIYRLKGVLYYGMKGFEQKIIVHKVGRHISWSAEDWKNHETPSTNIVAIGVNYTVENLRKSFESCIDPTPDKLTGDTIDIMRLKGF